MVAPRKTRRTETVEEISTDANAPENVDEFEEVSEDLNLVGFLSEIKGGADTIVNVYRASGKGKRLGFMFAFSPDEMTGGELMEKIRDDYGPGDYRVHVRDDNQIVANRPITIADKIERVESEKKHSSEFGPMEFIAMMQQQQESTQAMFANTMTAMAEAFKGNQNNAPPSVDPVAMQNSILAGLATMKEIADSGKKDEPSAVEMMLKGIEFAKDMVPKTGETNVTDLGMKFVEMFPMLAQMGQKTTPNQSTPNPGYQPQQPVRTGPNPAIDTSGPEKTTPKITTQESEPKKVDESEAAFMAQAKANLQWLCRLAQQDKDPSLYAEVILDQMGVDAVLEFVGQDNSLEQLAQIEPAVNLYSGWFTRLKDAILELSSDDEPEVTPDETPKPTEVLARIDASGLRREERQGASVNIPPLSENAEANGGDSESASDTGRA